MRHERNINPRYTAEWGDISSIPGKQTRAIYRANDWYQWELCFSPSPFLSAAPTENCSLTLIESRLNAMNASVGLVEFPPSAIRKSRRHSHFFLSPAGSLCLCCRGKIHGKAFDSPGDLFVPSAMRRGYLTLNRGGLVCTLAGMQSADYRCPTRVYFTFASNLHGGRNIPLSFSIYSVV